MNLDEFADYRISVGIDNLTIRHTSCSENWVDKIELPRPFFETNLKWLMIKATEHWSEVHKNDKSAL